MEPLIEVVALGAATVLIFFYGVAQRHLKKAVASQLESYRAQTAAAEIRHEERLEVLRADITAAEQNLAAVKKQAAEVEALLDANQKKAEEVRAYLATADGQAAKEAARVELEQYKQELERLKIENPIVKSGTIISQASYLAKVRCADTFQTLMLDAVEFWKKQPGRQMRIVSGDTTYWVGSSVNSLQSHIKTCGTWTWNGFGQCTLSVA